MNGIDIIHRNEVGKIFSHIPDLIRLDYYRQIFLTRIQNVQSFDNLGICSVLINSQYDNPY